jgi:Putative DNA-binding domain
MNSPTPHWPSTSARFAASLLDPHTPAPVFTGPDTKRFDVYRNNVSVGLVRALEANFPAVRTLVGADFFAAMALDFIRLHPPASRIMAEYGKEMPDFLSTAAPLKPYPYLADVAQLEILWLESFHEADSVPLKNEDLQAAVEKGQGDIRLVPHPALRLHSSNYAANTIMKTSRAGGSLTSVDAAQPECTLITRPQLTVNLHTIATPQFVFLQSLSNNETLADAAESAAEIDAGFNVAEAISLMLVTGAFAMAKP